MQFPQLTRCLRHRELLVCIAVVCTASRASAVDSAVLDAETRRVDVIARAAPAVVSIFSADAVGGGTGVLISADGYAVTNYHVVEGLGPFMKCGLNDGNIYHAVLVGIDPTGDVAVVQLLGRDDFPHAVIADSDAVEMGDWVYAMGNPFLLATNLQPTISYGIVSGTHRYQYPAGTFLEYTDCLQVDASINPGNSGGPLFNDDGELVGINGRASFEKRGRVNIGAGYAISINQVLHFLDHLKSGRIVDHATLGAVVTGANDGAVYVSNILEQSDAFRRGLRIGDELVSFAGRPIRTVNQFKNILGIYPQGWRVPLVYRRDDEKHEIIVRLRALHRAAELQPGAAEEPNPEENPERPDQPENPIPLPMAEETPPVVPPEYAHLYVEKRGFANWYFNQLHRDRVLTGIQQLGDFSAVRGNWELTGTTAAGEAVSIKLSDKAVAVTIADAPSVQLADQEFTDQPAGSGGLVAALYHLRRLLTDPDQYFTEFYYLGSEPYGTEAAKADVLITTRGTVTSRWYFAKDDGRLLGWETSLLEDAEPCRVEITAFRDFATRRLPSQLTIRHGDATFAEMTIEAATLAQ
jgi:serine protease Do